MKDIEPEDPRVRLAIERTLLAWVRTGLAMMGFGFVVARFGVFLREVESASQATPLQSSIGMSLWIGTALILLGVVVNVLVLEEHLRLKRPVCSESNYGIRSWLLGVGVTFVLAILGIAMTIYLILLER